MNAILNTGSSSSDTTTILRNQADLLKTPNAELLGGEVLKKMQKRTRIRKMVDKYLQILPVRTERLVLHNPFRMALHLGEGKEVESNNSFYVKTMMATKTVTTMMSTKRQTVNTSLSLETFANKLPLPHLVPKIELKNVHPVLKRLFGNEIIPNVPLAGGLKHFTRAWKILTSDPDILPVVEGYQVPVISPPVQEHIPFSPIMSSAQERLVDVEVAEMLRKGAITLCTHQTGEFISNLFLVDKKHGGHRPVINLKHLNQFVPYQHFKIEGLHYLKFMLQEGDYTCASKMPTFQSHCTKILGS